MLKISASRAQVRKQTPTEAQCEAGNYPKLHLDWQGLQISVENPRGSTRSGVSSEGKKWTTRMKSDYGYIRGTKACDGDHVDCFLSPKYKSATVVHIVDQVDPDTREYDEPKCMIGWPTQAEAERAYLSNYERGWRGLGAITTVSVPEFKRWVNSTESKRPYSRALG